MIDTGVDDLSCFMIDWSGNITTRTPGYEYMQPITEPFRRKVIQYIMWGDGVSAHVYQLAIITCDLYFCHAQGTVQGI